MYPANSLNENGTTRHQTLGFASYAEQLEVTPADFETAEQAEEAEKERLTQLAELRAFAELNVWLGATKTVKKFQK